MLNCGLLADRAKAIKTSAVINESPTDKLIRELREENAKLMEMLKKGILPDGAGAGAGAEGTVFSIHFQDLLFSLFLFNFVDMERMREEMSAQQQKMQEEMENMEKSWKDKVAEEEKRWKVSSLLLHLPRNDTVFLIST